MPAKILKIVAKNKTDLKDKYSKTIKKAYKDGFVYVKEGYNDNRVKRVKGGYELSVTVHTWETDLNHMGKSIIETFKNQYPGREYEIEISCPEFTCVCPKTGQPDFAVINIKYVPDKLCLELKSLKLYMFSYRNEGAFHEHVTNKILDDLVSACKPIRAEVTGDFNVRGGIKTVVRARYKKRK